MASLTCPILSGAGTRIGELRPLAPTAEETATVPPSIQPQYRTSRIHKSNGLADHDLEVTISAWRQAWIALKPWISGLLVLAGVGMWHFLNSPWFNAPVPASQLYSVTSEQRVTNTELKSDIHALSQTAQSHERVLEKLATVTGEMRADVAFIKGAFSSLPLQAYSPPPAHFPPVASLQQTVPLPGRSPWRTSSD